MAALVRYPCRACGYRTLVVPPPGPPGTWALCPVCFWEDATDWADDRDTAPGGSNAVTLRQAQANFAKLAVVDPQFRDAVRPAHPDEARDPAWRTEEAAEHADRTALLVAIQQAFDGVSRDGGVSLHQTEVIDNYGGAEESRRARALDRDRTWQEIPHRDLAEVCGTGGIAFFDPIGWRYHLPAYLTWFLTGGAVSGSFAAECLIYSLDIGDRSLERYHLDRFERLSAQQATVVVQFLHFVVRHRWLCHDDASRALDRYWMAKTSSSEDTSRK